MTRVNYIEKKNSAFTPISLWPTQCMIFLKIFHRIDDVLNVLSLLFIHLNNSHIYLKCVQFNLNR